MNFALTEEQVVLQRSVRELCERIIIPYARRWDAEERFPHEIIPAPGRGMGASLGMQIPEAYGGAGMKFHDYVVALEEVARADASVGLTMASHNSLCTGHLFLAGNEAQRAKYLPRLASGQALGGWGLTEPGSRLSDAGAALHAPSRAAREGRRSLDHQRHEDLHHAGLGRLDLRRAGLDEPREEGQGPHGLHRRVRHRPAPVPARASASRRWGCTPSDTTELVFEDVEVPGRAAPGRHRPRLLRHAGKILDKGRIGIGAWAVGIGRAAASRRRSRGTPRSACSSTGPSPRFQGVQHMLADMATELDAARLLRCQPGRRQPQDQKLRTMQESGHGEVLRGAAR